MRSLGAQVGLDGKGLAHLGFGRFVDLGVLVVVGAEGEEGGDLSGLSSNAQIVAGAVGTPELANGAVTTGKISSSGATSGQVLTYSGTAVAWTDPATTSDASALTTGLLGIDRLPAGSTLTVAKSGSTWPARPTSRSDVIVQWKGADPSPPIVSSGTGGMLDNVDIRLVTP